MKTNSILNDNQYKNLKNYISIFLENRNKSPKWIKKGKYVMYKGKKCKVKVPDARGQFVLIRYKNKDKLVSYKKLKKVKK